MRESGRAFAVGSCSGGMFAQTMSVSTAQRSFHPSTKETSARPHGAAPNQGPVEVRTGPVSLIVTPRKRFALMQKDIPAMSTTTAGHGQIGAVEGLSHLEDFCVGFEHLITRDGTIDEQEAGLYALLNMVVAGFQEWISRLLILLSNLRRFHGPPLRTGLLAREHEDCYGFNPLATAAD